MKPWYWERRSLPPACSGARLWEALFATEPTAALLESPIAADPALARYSIAAGPPRHVWTPPVGEIFSCLRGLLERAQAVRKALPAELADLPFAGGYLGWLGYDAAWEIERLPRCKDEELPFPVAFWYEPRAFAVSDRVAGEVWLAASTPEELAEMQAKFDAIAADPVSPALPDIPPASSLRLRSDRHAYTDMVNRAQAFIRAGDIFQTNLSLRFAVQWPGSGWELYRHLQTINPSPFASYWRTPWGEVISASPERLVSLRGDRAATRPIAGTRPRGTTTESDRQQETDLRSNAKERAEHIMLVDLERNDLGRVCTWGSVTADELLAIERYSHVMHLVSNVSGVLRPDRDGVDLIRAMFPGGTITGCPKVRCMEIIEGLEPCRRSLFYGSCGYLDARGHLDLNILIRTLLKADDRVWGQVGAGIVADSLPEKEWHESLQKAQAQLAALGLDPSASISSI